MMRRILLPLERSDDETGALAFVRSLAGRRRVEVLLLRIEEWPLLGSFGRGWVPAWRSGDLGAVKAHLDQHEGIRTRILSAEAAPSACVLEQARARAASLILLPYRTERSWLHVMHGHAGERILRESPIPVLAVPCALASAMSQPISRILYPYEDDDPATVPGLRHVIDFAQLYEASVHLLRIGPTPSAAPEDRSTEERLLSLLRRREVAAEVVSGSGNPVQDILTAVSRRTMDLVILSKSHDSDRTRTTLARDVLHAGAVPLLLTREGSIPSSLVGAETPLRVGI